MLREENRRLRGQLNALVGVAGGVIWLDNNIHNYGSDEWRGYFKAVLRDAHAALAKVSRAVAATAAVSPAPGHQRSDHPEPPEDDPFLPIGHPTC